MTKRKNGGLTLKWDGDDLLLKSGKALVARRRGSKWTSYIPSVEVTDRPDGQVSVHVMTKEEYRRRLGDDLKRKLNACKSPEEAEEMMRRMGYVKCPDASIGEMYHDAVKRNDDPDEIEWLKQMWMEEQGVRQ